MPCNVWSFLCVKNFFETIIYAHVCMYVCVLVIMQFFVHAWTHVCMYVCMYACMYDSSIVIHTSCFPQFNPGGRFSTCILHSIVLKRKKISINLHCQNLILYLCRYIRVCIHTYIYGKIHLCVWYTYVCKHACVSYVCIHIPVSV